MRVVEFLGRGWREWVAGEWESRESSKEEGEGAQDGRLQERSQEVGVVKRYTKLAAITVVQMTMEKGIGKAKRTAQ